MLKQFCNLILSLKDKLSAHQHLLSPTHHYFPDYACFILLFSHYITEIVDWASEDFKNADHDGWLFLNISIIEDRKWHVFEIMINKLNNLQFVDLENTENATTSKASLPITNLPFIYLKTYPLE